MINSKIDSESEFQGKLTLNLPLMEDFHTLQGEGYHTGTSAYFIRLAGCDVGCVWCDVKESWDAADHNIVSVTEIVNRAKNSKAPIAVITGGEPALYDLTELTNELIRLGIRVHIETSGTRELKGKFHWVTVSPKKFKNPLESVLNKADEYKLVVYDKSDMAWALKYVNNLKPGCKLFLQPEYSRKEKMTPIINKYILEHPEWRISLQTHKIIGIP